MKNRIVIAASIGVIISAVLTALITTLSSTQFGYLLLPGYAATVFLWGAHGWPDPAVLPLAVLGGVNAIFYGLITLGILQWFGQTKVTSHIPKDGQSNQN